MNGHDIALQLGTKIERSLEISSAVDYFYYNDEDYEETVY